MVLVLKSTTSPTLLNGQGYVDFSKNGERIANVTHSIDMSGNVGQSIGGQFDMSTNIVRNLVYFTVLVKTDPSANLWSNANTSQLTGKKVNILADVR